MAIEAGRYVVKNGNDPNPGNITEETESELEEFIDYAKIVMALLDIRYLGRIYLLQNQPTQSQFYTWNMEKARHPGKEQASGLLC